MASYSRLDDDTLMIEDARIIFRNFEGRPGRYNQEGRKNFGVVIEDQAVADQLTAEDWNIKVLEPRDEDEGPTPGRPRRCPSAR